MRLPDKGSYRTVFTQLISASGGLIKPMQNTPSMFWLSKQLWDIHFSPHRVQSLIYIRVYIDQYVYAMYICLFLYAHIWFWWSFFMKTPKLHELRLPFFWHIPISYADWNWVPLHTEIPPHCNLPPDLIEEQAACPTHLHNEFLCFHPPPSQLCGQ